MCVIWRRGKENLKSLEKGPGEVIKDSGELTGREIPSSPGNSVPSLDLEKSVIFHARVINL